MLENWECFLERWDRLNNDKSNEKERKGEKLNQLTTKNIQKCINWCIKNEIPHHKTTTTGNIFLGGSEAKKSYYRK